MTYPRSKHDIYVKNVPAHPNFPFVVDDFCVLINSIFFSNVADCSGLDGCLLINVLFLCSSLLVLYQLALCKINTIFTMQFCQICHIIIFLLVALMAYEIAYNGNFEKLFSLPEQQQYSVHQYAITIGKLQSTRCGFDGFFAGTTHFPRNLLWD